ncbi:TaqI-like C-terminal specificity domain-containing protein [Pontibacter populi]|uniref:site-specific DNA-methyltransferase (adenine-specific) n=2 Tax=Pontibacter populi TaxID=890055 RepID=A0ABV1RXP1_9BACT
MLKTGGKFSYIIPNKWMRAGYGQALRQWLQSYSLMELLDFGDLPVFEEATTYPLIVSVTKQQPELNYRFKAVTINTLQFEKSLTNYVAENAFDVQADLLPASGWTLSNSIAQQLLEKLKNTGTPLGEYVDGKIYRGVLTGLNEAFVIDEATAERLIDEDERSARVIKRFIAGRDVKRYQKPKVDKYLILFPAGFTYERMEDSELEPWEWIKENYTSLANFLAPHEEKAKKRADKGNFWWELRACAYYHEFQKNKILFQEIATFQAFTWDEVGAYSNNKTFIIPNADLYLLGLLNSKVTWYFINQIASKLQGGALAMQTPYTFQIPIVSGDEETKATITSLVEQILTIKQADAAANTSRLEAEIDVLVYRLYNLTYDEVLLVDPAFALTEAAYNQPEVSYN